MFYFEDIGLCKLQLEYSFESSTKTVHVNAAGSIKNITRYEAIRREY